MKTFVFIPTKYPNGLLNNLLDNLIKDSAVTKVFIMNNGTEELHEEGKVEVWDMRGFSIYEMWNRAIEYIQFNYKEKTNIAILNDDIEIIDNTIKTLTTYLRNDSTLGIISPDPNGTYWSAGNDAEWSVRLTNTTAGAGGITGYCFVLRGELPVKVDESLKLYWGDDDLVNQVLAQGYSAGYLVGLPIFHLGSATIKKMDQNERRAIMESDRLYFNQKYRENRQAV